MVNIQFRFFFLYLPPFLFLYYVFMLHQIHQLAKNFQRFSLSQFSYIFTLLHIMLFQYKRYKCYFEHLKLQFAPIFDPIMNVPRTYHTLIRKFIYFYIFLLFFAQFLCRQWEKTGCFSLNKAIFSLLTLYKLFLITYKNKLMQQSDHVNSDKNTHLLKLPQNLDPSEQKMAGYWNFQQHKLYVIFVDFFRKQLSSKGKRRDNRIFKVMASFLKTRNPIQCRSHHIKLLRTYKCSNNIVKNLKQRLGNQDYFQLFKSVTAQYKIFDRKSDEYERVSNKKTKVDNISFTKCVGVQTDQMDFYLCQQQVALQENRVNQNGPASFMHMEYEPIYFFYTY